MDAVRLEHEPFDPWPTLVEYQRTQFDDPAAAGATSVFIGTMRDHNEGDEVRSMMLEHYPGMTEQHLRQIIAEARSRWDVLACLIVHRVGEIRPADTIMLTAVWSAHRKQAFEACRYLVEELKHRAPFWKRETLVSGETRWVETNTPG